MKNYRMLFSSQLKEKIYKLPTGPGVYLMKGQLGEILYVGKAKNVKKRVLTYFQPNRRLQKQPKLASLLESISDIEIVEVRSEQEALILESQLIKDWKPKYNTVFVDDKRYLLVRVDTHRDIPRFCLVRARLDSCSRYFGPFVHSRLLRGALVQMRRRFGIVLGDAHPKKIGSDRYQLYNDLRSEIYGHPNEVTVEEYRERMEKACAFLEGKALEWLEELRQAMEKASKERQYEKAAELRDIVSALKEATFKTRKFTHGVFHQRGRDFQKAEESLQKALELPDLPKHIECFDISHISGHFVVASLVCFKGGKPDKKQYRRFQIKRFIGNDDYRAMEEVVGRRYLRLYKENKDFPDLIVVDGGLGQVHSAKKAFAAHHLPLVPIVGLAKREERIVKDARVSLCLPERDPGLHLLQRIRDEAHRFANAYGAELRSKQIRESLLDEFPGLGSVKKKALLTAFKTLGNLRKATVEELQEVPGIGPKMADQLKAFLNQK